MPITNLNNTHLTPDESSAIETALTALEKELKSVNVQLTPDERKDYGSINEQNKLLVNKVKDYYDDQPELSDPSINWTEFLADFASRPEKEMIIFRLEALINKLKNAKTLHDYDNFQTALEDYGYTSLMAGRGNPAFETKYNELKQFFPRTKVAKTDTDLEKEKPEEN